MKNRKAVLTYVIINALPVAVAGWKEAALLRLYNKAITSDLVKSLGGRTGCSISMFAVQQSTGQTCLRL